MDSWWILWFQLSCSWLLLSSLLLLLLLLLFVISVGCLAASVAYFLSSFFAISLWRFLGIFRVGFGLWLSLVSTDSVGCSAVAGGGGGILGRFCSCSVSSKILSRFLTDGVIPEWPLLPLSSELPQASGRWRYRQGAYSRLGGAFQCGMKPIVLAESGWFSMLERSGLDRIDPDSPGFDQMGNGMLWLQCFACGGCFTTFNVSTMFPRTNPTTPQQHPNNNTTTTQQQHNNNTFIKFEWNNKQSNTQSRQRNATSDIDGSDWILRQLKLSLRIQEWRDGIKERRVVGIGVH